MCIIFSKENCQDRCHTKQSFYTRMSSYEQSWQRQTNKNINNEKDQQSETNSKQKGRKHYFDRNC